MKHPLETLDHRSRHFADGFPLLPAAARPRTGANAGTKLVTTFHLMDLSQLYTLLFCLWFLVLGAIEYFVLRFIWRRWFSLAD